MLELLKTIFEHNAFAIVIVANIIDSTPVVSFLVPEELIMSIAGLQTDSFSTILLLISASAVSLVFAQAALYGLGMWQGSNILRIFQINREREEQLQEYVLKNTVFLNITMRLSSTLRAAMGIIAGKYQLSFTQFILFEILAAIVRSAIFINLGYILNLSATKLDSIITEIGIILIVIIIASFGINTYINRALFKE